jgi:hypothetical protein
MRFIVNFLPERHPICEFSVLTSKKLPITNDRYPTIYRLVQDTVGPQTEALAGSDNMVSKNGHAIATSEIT